MSKRDAAKAKAVAEIARTFLGIETLKAQGLDRLDFHDLGVVGIDQALSAAFEAGRKAAGR